MKNKYNVPLKLWRSFKGDNAKRVFNDVMEQSLKNQLITMHPKAAKIPANEWKTLCWNFACYAAWSVAENPLEKGATVIDINSKGEEVKERKIK